MAKMPAPFCDHNLRCVYISHSAEELTASNHCLPRPEHSFRMGISDIAARPSIARPGSPTYCGRVQPVFATAPCTPGWLCSMRRPGHMCSRISGEVKTRAMQARCDIDALGLRNAGTPTRAFVGSTAVHVTLFGLVAALAGGGYLALARAGVIGSIGPADLTLLRFGVAGILLLPVLLRYGIRDLAGVGWRRGLVLAVLAGPPFALLQIRWFCLCTACPWGGHHACRRDDRRNASGLCGITRAY